MAWRPAPLPADEPQRQAALRGLGWLDPGSIRLSQTAPVEALRALADAARRLCACSVSFISLVDAEHACQVGVEASCEVADGDLGDSLPRLRVEPRAQVICAHAVAENAFLEVPDILLDHRFADAINQPACAGWRFYAAVPLRLRGHAVGTLCVVASRPHTLSAPQRMQLQRLAVAAESLLSSSDERESLVREQQRLADLARSSGDWLWELDELLCYRWISDDIERLAGVPAASVIGLALMDEPCVDSLGEPLRSGATLRGRLSQRVALTRVVSRFEPPRGGALYVSRSAVPVFDEAGTFRGWRGSARDVTSQVLAARETRERDHRLHKLLAQMPGAAFQLRLQPDGTQPHYLYVNQGLRELLVGPGGSAEEHAMPTLRRVAPEDRHAVVQAVLESMRDLNSTRVEYRFERADGQLRWLETRATPERLADGRYVLHGFTWDVTERRAAQDALREHETLRMAHDSVERASRAKSEFLSRVSHELRTPLNAILGFAQLMALDREQTLVGAQRHRLDGVRQAGQSLLALVDDVLDLSRIEQGVLTLRQEPIDLARLTRASIGSVEPLASARSVRLEAESMPPVRVWGDSAALEQVLVNLLSNAIKFNRIGGRVHVAIEASGDSSVTLHVSDEGEGLRPDQLAQLFQPFNRLGAERRRIGGTGLGLVIARGLARAMGGDIDVSSVRGEGSRFSLRLSAAGEHAGADEDAPSTEVLDRAHSESTGRVVLYVEDEPLNVLLMEEVFRTQPGWTLHIAHDGQAGIELAAETMPDLALIDMNLPDMGGVDVLKRIRSDPSTSTLLCVALSADSMSEQIAAAREAGFDDYWTKPIDFSRLLDQVREAIDTHRGTARG